MNDEITIEEFEARFDIDKRTLQNCMGYLENYSKEYPDDFKEYFKDTSALAFRKLPSHWGECAYWGKELLAELEISRGGIPLAVYVACYDLEGKGQDDWMNSLGNDECDGNLQHENPGSKTGDYVDDIPDENDCRDADKPDLVTPETKGEPQFAVNRELCHNSEDKSSIIGGKGPKNEDTMSAEKVV